MFPIHETGNAPPSPLPGTDHATHHVGELTHLEALEGALEELFVLDTALKVQGEEGVIVWQRKKRV